MDKPKEPLKRLIRDNDGHWYIIAENEVEQFQEWVQAQENCTETNLDYSSAMIPSPLNLRFENFIVV